MARFSRFSRNAKSITCVFSIGYSSTIPPASTTIGSGEFSGSGGLLGQQQLFLATRYRPVDNPARSATSRRAACWP